MQNLNCTTHVGDGDSSSFATVRDKCFEKFGDKYKVVKEECLGHVQKRMGKALLELISKMRGHKLDDGKSVGGKGRLTRRMVDHIQNNYGAAIRSNVGSIDAMYDAIWALFKHTVVDSALSLEQQHHLCPRNGWCKFWLDKEKYTEVNRLPEVFAKLLKPIFTRLSNQDLLSRCQGVHAKPKRVSQQRTLVKVSEDQILWVFQSPSCSL